MNGFSTINRLLGKKSKSQNISKSTNNLTSNAKLTRPLSQYDNNTSAIPLSSQLDSTTASTNSTLPFEQNFRITVHLPKGQLFVTRLGARTDLEKLLVLVCEHKQLDPIKYELRHPGDNSQVFSLDQTIGQVGLSEIRLCHKSDSYDNFNTGEILGLRNTIGRDSLSSSELSSRISKHTLITASQYSSTNSLNSSDSAGMSNSRSSLGYAHQPTSLQTLVQQKPPVAPARKKRAAPRPPSQNSQTISNGSDKEDTQKTPTIDTPQPPSTPELKPPNLARKEFHVSSPNLTHSSEMSLLRTAEFHKSNVSVDCNGNSTSNRDNNSMMNSSSNVHLNYNGTDGEGASLSPGLSSNLRPVSMSVLNNEIYYDENELNGNRGFIVNGSVADLSSSAKMPEPAPRKRLVIAKKKAPAPPPRGLTPVATPRSSTSSNTPPAIAEVSQTEETSSAERVPNDHKITRLSKPTFNEPHQNQKNEELSQQSQPATPTIKITPFETESSQVIETIERTTAETKVSKIQPIEPKINKVPPKLINGHTENLPNSTNSSPPSTPLSPVTPLTSSAPSTHSQLEPKLSSGTSSDDDEVKVYNIKLGKTIVQPRVSYEVATEVPEKKKAQPITLSKPMQTLTVQTECISSPVSTMSPASPQRPESPEWTYTIPAPPTFADSETVAATYHSEGSDRVSSTNRSLNSDHDDSLTTNDDFHSETTITSDIEDGYRGVGSKQPFELMSTTPEPDSVPSKNKRPENLVKTATGTDHTKVTVSDFSRPKSASPPRSPIETKADVITELNSLINGERGTDLETNRKRNNHRITETNIHSAKPSDLANFTIQPYNQSSSTNSEHVEEVKQPVNNEAETHVSIKGDNAEDGSYIKATKRSSLTQSNSVVGQLSRQRASNVVRSDSFHCTRTETRFETGNLSQSRSSSQISLETLQKQISLTDRFLDTNRRKSSSELSIGETPDLQSLIVMRSILSSRKNSLSNGSGSSNIEVELKSPPDTIPPTPTTPVPPLEVKNTTVIETVRTIYGRPSLKDFVSLPDEGNDTAYTFERKAYVETDSVEQSNNKNIECKNTSLVENKSNELQSRTVRAKQLNSEQPIDKMVNGSIPSPTNNSDCDSSKENPPKNKILSKTQNSAPEPSERIYRYQGPPSINLSTWSERPKSQVAIKSDNDYIFGVGTGKARLSISNEVKTDVQSRDIQKGPVKPALIRTSEYKKALSMVEAETQPPIERKPSNENGMVISHTQLGHPMPYARTLPRPVKPTFTPVVKGFKSLDPSESLPSEPSKDDQTIVQLRPATVVRSNSAVSTSILRLSNGGSNLQMVNIYNNEPSPPSKPQKSEPTSIFSQVALRRTGFKDKILANEDTVDNVPKPCAVRSISEQQNSAKIEMKITNTVNQNFNNRFSTPAPLVTVNKNLNSPLNRSTSITVNSEIPPPPPPIIRSVVTKQNSACIPDTRDQLLNAIRSFKKESLKRS